MTRESRNLLSHSKTGSWFTGVHPLHNAEVGRYIVYILLEGFSIELIAKNGNPYFTPITSKTRL